MADPTRPDAAPLAARGLRPFSLLDAMVLVAAAAVAFALIRAYHSDFDLAVGTATPRTLLLTWARGWPSCVVVSWSLAIMAVRLREPRPPMRRLGRQPGLVAATAMSVALMAGGVRCLLSFRPTHQIWPVLLGWVDSAVLGAWLSLIVARRWRPEPSWIDRSGRLLGAYWIALFFIARFASQ